MTAAAPYPLTLQQLLHFCCEGRRCAGDLISSPTLPLRAAAAAATVLGKEGLLLSGSLLQPGTPLVPPAARALEFG